MAVDTLDKMLAGFKNRRWITGNAGASFSVVSYARGFSYYMSAGNQGIGTGYFPGTNGINMVAPISGTLMRSNPPSGQHAHLARVVSFSASAGGRLLLLDRLWSNSGNSVTSLSLQTVGSITLPPRDDNGTSDGVGVQVAMEVYGALGNATAGTATITYTNSDGVSGRTGYYNYPSGTAVAGTFEIFTLQGSDKGVQSIQNFQITNSRVSGNMRLVMFRQLVNLDQASGVNTDSIDPFSGDMPRIYDDSCIWPVFMYINTAQIGVHVEWVEVHG